MRGADILTAIQQGAELDINERESDVDTKDMFSPGLVSEISPHRAEIRALNPESSSKRFTPGSQPEPYTAPLSFAQERLWFLDQLNPNSAVYNSPLATHLDGPLHVGALQQSLTEIVRRHETLRTTFPIIEDRPVQLIGAASSVNVPLIDLSGLINGEQEVEVLRQKRDEAQKPFDLMRGPLLRVSLLRVGPQEHVLLLTMHHIISDAWSQGVLLRELSVFYRTFVTDLPLPLKELPIQYADYAVWQRQWLKGEVLESQLRYWEEQLGGAPQLLELPTGQLRPAVQSYRGASERLQLSVALLLGLEELSRRENVTLFMTLLTAFKTLLYRYTGQEDIVVGVPVAGRNHAEIEDLIGFFINTLALRTDLSANPTFLELLGRVRKVCLGAYAHQDIPFELLVQALQPERALSRSPLFQVMLVLENAPRRRRRKMTDLQLQSMPNERSTSRFDLTLFLTAGSGGLKAVLEYNGDLFEAATIRRLLGHFEVLLSGIVADPGQRLSDLPLLTEAERQQLLVEWNDTKRDYPKDQCVHELFEAQVERSPEAVAIAFEDQQLTYRQLNQRANQMAHYLRGVGVGLEVLVGVMMERSVEMVVALLGILKAGGAYMPLDPSYPKERLEFMLKDAQVEVLLTGGRTRAPLREYEGRAVCVDSGWEKFGLESGEDLDGNAESSSLAYLLYTSGSSGVPKGVAITHRSAAVLVGWGKEAFSEEELSGVLASTSICFDLSVFELFVPLSSGGKVILIGNVLELPRLPEARMVTLINTVPSAIAELLRMDGIPVSAGMVNLAGEPLEPALTQALYQRPGVRRVCNLYGPTEDTTYSTWYCVGREGKAKVPIGRPVADTQIYLLDEYSNPVPVGAPGQLFIGGAGLARGYWRRPELTAERFISNPFSERAGARLYRTGDLACYLSNGDIEFLGRLDHQVKLRGYRVELGEIEAVLSQHPVVREAVVVAREVNPGDKRLVAYLVAREKSPPTLSGLREFLRAKLPEYMVPSAFVFLDSLPLTPNGKVDRRALPELDQSHSKLEAAAYVAPRTPVEEVLAGIWVRVLGVERVGMGENFFELGGHSLLATQVISQVREVFSIELPLRRLFETPTVAGLAEGIEIAQRTGLGVELPPIEPVSRDEKLPLSFAQERLWFLDQWEPDKMTYVSPMIIRLKGQVDVGVLERSLTEIVSRHEVLRTTFPIEDDSPVQHIAPPAPVSLEPMDLSKFSAKQRGREVRRIVREETRRRMALDQGPLFRVRLLRIAPDEYLMLVIKHHIIFDGWSQRLFLREIATLYHAFAKGEPSPLAPLPCQYADYAVWQRHLLEGERLQSHLRYWQEKLEGAPPMVDLPTDRPHSGRPSVQGARVTLRLPASLVNQLKALCRREKATMYMALLAAFKIALFQWSGQRDLVIGTVTANRSRPEIEDLIGCFIELLPLRSKLSADQTTLEFLQQVKETVLEAALHQELPFGKIVERAKTSRSRSQTPIYNVAFLMQNFGLTRYPQDLVRFTQVRLNRLEEDGLREVEALLDLRFIVIPLDRREEMSLFAEYKTDLFNRDTISRVMNSYCVILNQLNENVTLGQLAA